MSVLDRLAGALGRNDEQPNIALAIELAAAGDKITVAELADAIGARSVAVANDAIKVLYEIGGRRPALIAPHVEAFFKALKSRNNRLVWGALSALDTLTAFRPDLIGPRLPEILEAADRSSVIARDKTVSMLATLATKSGAAPAAWGLLVAMLRTSAINQTPMYAELALKAAPMNDPAALAKVLNKRLGDIHQPAKRRRIEKVLRALEGPKAR